MRLGLLACCRETCTFHLLLGLEESAIACGLGHGNPLQLCVVPGGLGLLPFAGLGQLLGLDPGDQVVAELLGAGIFWQGL